MSQLSDSLSDNRRFRAWAGSAADLLPILDAMERQFADVRVAHMEERTAFYRSDAERQRKDLEAARLSFARQHPEATSEDEARDSWVTLNRRFHETALARLQEVQAEAEKFDEVSVMLRSKRGRDTRRTRGRSSDIVDYLTHRDVRELELSAPAGSGSGHHVSVRFDEDGVRITASSADSRWTSAALTQVTEAVRRRVPWWRWMRSLWFLIPLLAVASVFLMASVVGAVPRGAVDSSVLSVLFVVGVWALTPLAVWGASKALPPFEMTSSERPTGTRVFYVLGSAVASFVLGIIVNLVS